MILTCTQCGELHEAEEGFYKDKKHPTGYKTYCKTCHKKYTNRHNVPPRIEFKDQGHAGTPRTGWHKISLDDRWRFIEAEINGNITGEMAGIYAHLKQKRVRR